MPSDSGLDSGFDIMKTGKIIFAATAAVLFAFQPTNAGAMDDWEPRRPQKTKAELARENARYRAIVDSLKAEIESLNLEMLQKDSLTTEIMEIYEDNDTIAYSNEVTDSLLNLWYIHKAVGDENAGAYDMDTVHFSSDVPDSVYIRRIRNMNSFISLPYNSIVKNYIVLYSEKMPDRIGKIIGLSRYYMPIFEEILDRYGLPEELKAMAIIESSLNPTAVSRAGAKGMWQFMYSTAKLYGLTINSFVDERLDPVASAEAAARYLKDSYRIFGDWNLAIASYNCGAGNVNRAIRRSGGKRAFWDIYPYLPRETRGYVPAFVGALYTMKYYKEHGIEPEAVAIPPAVDTFMIHKMLHFKQINELVGVPLDELKNLNPQYRHEIIPGNEREYILRLPYSYVNDFIAVEDSLYSYKADEFFNPVTIKKIKDGGDGQRIIYRVRSGDVLGKIALRYRVTVSQIRRWNNLRGNMIRVGQRLVIYSGVQPSAEPAPAPKNTTAQARKSGIAPDTPYTTYTVKTGDTLYDIAKAYPGVSAQNIMDFNGIGSRIKPGMKIRIPKL